MAASTLIGEVGDIRPSFSFTSYSLELVDWSRVSPRRTGPIASRSPDSCESGRTRVQGVALHGLRRCLKAGSRELETDCNNLGVRV
jgi:hypothetical protein